MAKSNAERQSEYRKKHLKDLEGTGSRLNMVVSSSAKTALKRLAFRYSVTQRELLEHLLADEQTRVLSALSNVEQDEYYDCKAVTA